MPSSRSSGCRGCTRTTPCGRCGRRRVPRPLREPGRGRSQPSAAFASLSVSVSSTGGVVTGGEAAAQPRATGEPLTVSTGLARCGRAGDILVDEADPSARPGTSSSSSRSGGGSVSAFAVRLAADPVPGATRGRFVSPWSAVSASAPAAGRLRAGGRRPLVPAVHGARSRRRRQVTAGPASSSGSRRPARVARVAAFPTAKASRTGRCSRPSGRWPGSMTPTRPAKPRCRSSPICSQRRTDAELLAAAHGGGARPGRG